MEFGMEVLPPQGGKDLTIRVVTPAPQPRPPLARRRQRR